MYEYPVIPFGKKAVALALVAVYGVGHELHHVHRIIAEIQAPPIEMPMAKIRDFLDLRHGGEPEPPSGPLHTPWYVTSTSTASASVASALWSFPR